MLVPSRGLAEQGEITVHAFFLADMTSVLIGVCLPSGFYPSPCIFGVVLGRQRGALGLSQHPTVSSMTRSSIAMCRFLTTVMVVQAAAPEPEPEEEGFSPWPFILLSVIVRRRDRRALFFPLLKNMYHR